VPEGVAAIVLAAGTGTRLRGVCPDLPKGLLEVGGVPLIQRSLDVLRDCGVRRVILVTGYRADDYRRFIARHHPHVEMRFNPDYERAGSMRSLAAASGAVDGDFLLLESDLLYEPRAVTALLALPGSHLLLSGTTGQGDEVYAYGARGRLDRLDKARLPGRTPVGEFVGISRLTRDLLDAMCRHSDTVPCTRPQYQYDDCLSDLSARHHIGLHLVDDLVWAEIDDANQHRRAAELVVPRLV
jgi:2-aminoethylphosphonate-pyruvate transaminase